MSGYRAVFGIDSHARTTTVCAVDASTGEAGARAFRGNPYGETAERVAGLPQPSHGACEAGCTGFVPARELSAEGRRVAPIATDRIPTSPDDRSRKTDRPDAERLARPALPGTAAGGALSPCAGARPVRTALGCAPPASRKSRVRAAPAIPADVRVGACPRILRRPPQGAGASQQESSRRGPTGRPCPLDGVRVI